MSEAEHPRGHVEADASCLRLVLSLPALCFSYNIVPNELLESIPQGYSERKLVPSFGHAAGGWVHIDGQTDRQWRAYWWAHTTYKHIVAQGESWLGSPQVDVRSGDARIQQLCNIRLSPRSGREGHGSAALHYSARENKQIRSCRGKGNSHYGLGSIGRGDSDWQPDIVSH